MNFLQGLRYQFKGLYFGLKNPRLLFWGAVRFALTLIITFLAASLIVLHHESLLNALWSRPESPWIVWLWVVLSWILALFLVGLSAVVAYVAAQVVFSVVIMDHMSRITERLVTGAVRGTPPASLFKTFTFLIWQEIPRSLFPLIATVLFLVLGLLTPLGPLVTLLSAVLAAIFLAWDNTDLIPARNLLPFGHRLRLLFENLSFHLGFGLPLLIPGINILLLSFAPVGATLYDLDRNRTNTPKTSLEADPPAADDRNPA